MLFRSMALPAACQLAPQASGCFAPGSAVQEPFEFNVRLRWEKELDSGLKPFVQASFHHVGSSFSDVIDNVSIRYQSFNPTLGYAASTPVYYNGVLVSPGSVISPLPVAQKMAAYSTASAAFGVSKDEWRLEVFADNLTDARPELYKSGNDGELRVTTSRPRTIGMRISYSM